MSKTKMNTYDIYIDNKKPGIEERVEKLGQVRDENLTLVVQQAETKYKKEIQSFCEVYNSYGSKVFAIRQYKSHFKQSK